MSQKIHETFVEITDDDLLEAAQLAVAVAEKIQEVVAQAETSPKVTMLMLGGLIEAFVLSELEEAPAALPREMVEKMCRGTIVAGMQSLRGVLTKGMEDLASQIAKGAMAKARAQPQPARPSARAARTPRQKRRRA